MRYLYTLRCNDGKRNRKEQEFLLLHICTVTPISMTVGANRIVPAIAIPHPLGNPALDQEEEKKLRRGIRRKSSGSLTTEVDGQKVFE